MQKITNEQAAIIGAYTGYLCGSFADLHAYVERKLGRPIFTHELGDKKMIVEIKEAVRDDFISICHG